MKTITLKTKFIVCLLILYSLSACVDQSEFELDKLSTSTNLKPGFALPIAKASLKLSDFIDEMKDTLEFDKSRDSLICLKYKDDSIYAFQVADVYKMPVISPINKSFTIGEVVFDNYRASRVVTVDDIINQGETSVIVQTVLKNALDIPMPMPAFGPGSAGSFGYTFDKDFSSLTFASGTVDVTVSNKMPFPVDCKLGLFRKGELKPITNTIETNATLIFNGVNRIPAGESRTLAFDLAGAKFTKDLVCKMVEFSSPGTSSPITLKNTDYMGVDVIIKNAKVSEGSGNFPLMNESGASEFVLVSGTERIDEIKLEKGAVAVNIVSNLSTDCKLTLALPGTTRNGLPVTQTMIVAANQTTKFTFDLTNTITKPTKNGTTFPIQYDASSQGNYFKSTDKISLNATVSNLAFEHVKGFFGKKSYSITPDNIDLNLDIFDQIDGGLIFTDASMKINITNSIGVPVNMKLNLTGKSSTGKTALIPIDKNIAYPAVIGQTAIDSVKPSVIDFLSLPPKSVAYNGSATVNPTGALVSNFVTKTGKVKIGIAFDVPFTIQTENLEIRDTSSISVSSDDVKDAKNVAVQMDYVNKIPFDVKIVLRMVDKYGALVQEITPKDKDGNASLLKAATVKEDGSVSGSTSGTTLISLKKEEIEKLSLADKIIVVGTISTKGKKAQLHANATLDIKLFLKAAFNISL
jgi:hypothetical protein